MLKPSELLRLDKELLELLKLDDKPFLQRIAGMYPEMRRYLAKDEKAPAEINQQYKLASEVFGGQDVDPEARCTLSGLLNFKDVMNGNKSKHPGLPDLSDLSDDRFAKLQELTESVTKDEKSKEFFLYALAVNDLGRTKKLQNKHESLEIGHQKNPYLLLKETIEHAPEEFPGLKLLTSEQKGKYHDMLESCRHFIIGQFTQGENLPVNLEDINKMDPEILKTLLVLKLYDFSAAFKGAMSNENFDSFHTAIQVLTTEQPDKGKGIDKDTDKYKEYISARLKGVDLPYTADTDENFAKGRIVAMSRAWGKEKGAQIENVWKNLSRPVREILTNELNETGKGDRKAILLFRVPDLIAGAIGASGFEKGLADSLEFMANKCREIRGVKRSDGEGGVIQEEVSYADLEKFLANQKGGSREK